MTRWGEIKCERCAENDALWEGMERALEESDAREARLEAKLAMALRALEQIELSTDTQKQGAIAMATLAELKGDTP